MNEIPQREWEDYVLIRDRMKVLDSLPLWNVATQEEYDKLEDKLDDFHSKYDKESLDIRYENIERPY